MRRRKGRGAEEDSSEIDLTPMLDVVFIMLIFFIVTASFVKESTIDVNMPENQENPPPPTDDDTSAIVVKVLANDEIWMEERRVDIRSVRANIERIHAEKPQAPVVVKADANSTAKIFVAVADAAREANVYNVSLLPPEVKK
ncbi:biopolymer transporter ExbD [Aestuariicella hydrocarbonica]|uniref:Biopolymer transporter ExbD n=1 Tax=Pseudomaricurvus hydrocarbonicus TaxID=1470433 RepID=A0A9E5JUZ2_9GAMM|nr:biopolymer transporter ExbD [Aestuariicella hydrocarbonica]